MKGFASRAIHGTLKTEGHGALRMPVYDNVSFEQESGQAIHEAFAGQRPRHVYSRLTNPTVEDFEQRLRLVSGGLGAVATASGMAAISTLLLTLAGAGTNIVTTRHLFGNTLSLFARTMQPWGLEVRFTAMTEPAAVARAIDEQTRAIFLESITNPQLEVADFQALAEISRERRVPLVVDNTVTTPYLFNTRQHGVAVEILSSTKYISGGATTIGGIIIDNGVFDWRWSPRLTDRADKLGPHALLGALRREVFRNVGACLAPHHAYLQSLGLETMSLRIEKSCANALQLAGFLEKQAKVAAVNYPGLKGAPFHKLAAGQFHNRFGGILTFDLAGRQQCFALMDSLHLIRRATNVNDNKTLILHPASTIFNEYTAEEQAAMGVRPAMLRLSAGIEDYEDIEEDLARGLAAL